ncbi:hypothetical protein LIN78_12025 [Leeia sp. TBRC 13508]|uniref:Uncharacterized protein n=1 Tax=Leeia speluncae TaxID=2884804 RepID=A0ABS8D821_9NEIS|nr:hypothetical protein [Leeia speluncae]MCB6184272.1 hypothetical protein [Leeia speluncae]
MAVITTASTAATTATTVSRQVHPKKLSYSMEVKIEKLILLRRCKSMQRAKAYVRSKEKKGGMMEEWLYLNLLQYKRTLLTLAIGALITAIAWCYATYQVQNIHTTGLIPLFDAVFQDKAQSKVNKSIWGLIAFVLASTWRMYKRDRKRNPFGV